MRRGKLNKSAYIFIIISAIFTIIAYVADQLVINFENKNRIILMNYNNLNSDLKSYEATSLKLDSLGFQLENLLTSQLKLRNFYIKNILYAEYDEKFKKNFSGEFAISNFKLMTLQNNRSFYLEIFKFVDDYNRIFSNKIFKKLDIKTDVLIEVLESPETIFNNNLDKFYVKKYDDIQSILVNNNLDEFTLKNWQDLRNFRLLYLENIFNFNNKLEKIIEEIDDYVEEIELDLGILFKERKKISSTINYFILTGIISQIMTLFFLLVLFRHLILNKII